MFDLHPATAYFSCRPHLSPPFWKKEALQSVALVYADFWHSSDRMPSQLPLTALCPLASMRATELHTVQLLSMSVAARKPSGPRISMDMAV